MCKKTIISLVNEKPVLADLKEKGWVHYITFGDTEFFYNKNLDTVMYLEFDGGDKVTQKLFDNFQEYIKFEEELGYDISEVLIEAAKRIKDRNKTSLSVFGF